MLNISEELKAILKNDRFPMTDTVAPKDLEITFDGMSPIYAGQVVDDSFSLTESIIAEDDIRFGTCRASQIKFKLANVTGELKGKEFTIDQLIGGIGVIPLGKYKVESAKLQDDLIFKEVIAYDKLKDTDVDVADWYNGLFPTGSETYTLKQFRSSLLAYLGIEEVEQTLPNDDMVVTKTIEPTQISGRTVLEATVELNGAFGHIDRYGLFKRIVLQPAYGLYPSETLYPAEDLYPISETDTGYVHESIIDENIGKAMYKSVRFEEYTVKEIDKLQIRSEENDIGAIVGSGSNTYVIEGNFLVFGKSASELKQIATNVYGNIAKRPYRPYEAESIGLPYIEVGDSLEFATDDTVHGYVLHRTLTGIQSLWDEIEAPGSELREQNFGVNKELIQLQGRSTKIKKDVEGVRVEVENLEKSTNNRFEITDEAIQLEAQRATEAEGELRGSIDLTAKAITAEVTRATEAEGELSGSIDVLAGQVVLKVDANGNIAMVDLDADPSEGTKVTVKADNISLEGLVTANGYFKILEDGSIEATNGKFEGEIKSTNPSTGSVLKMLGADLLLTDANNAFIAGIYSKGQINGKSVTAVNGHFTYLNSATPITSNNIGQQEVAYATNSGRAATADFADNATTAVLANYATSAGSVSGLTTNQITASNTGYGNIDFLGFDNAAGVNWVQANYQPLSTSDLRLKYDIYSLDDMPDDIFYNLKPKRFRYKTGNQKGIVFGLIAQQLENNFIEHGLNPEDYNLLDIEDVRAYTDDGQYVKDKTHRINYINLIPWMINIIQKQNKRIALLEDKIV